LYLALAAITYLFGVPAKYADTTQVVLIVVSVCALAAAALALGGPALLHGTDETRRHAIAGLLLVAPWIVFAVMPGYGPPWQTTAAQNHLRYKALLLNIVLVGGGLTMLREALAVAGERLWSALGWAAAAIATPAYLTWCAILMASWLARDHPQAGLIALNASPLGLASDILLFFGGLLTYVATAAFAVASYRAGWLTARGATAFVVVSALAAVALLARGMEYPAKSTDYYLVPGFIVGVPAVPWLMPFLLGVRCLRLAAANTVKTAASPSIRPAVLP
jgi:hypothetical protein